MTTATGLGPIRLAVALAHCLPDCDVELTDAAGATVRVGFGAGAGITPCLACHAVASAMRTAPHDLGPLLGLCRGCPLARLVDDAIADSHVGLGVYRYRNEQSWGYVFATLAPASIARGTVVTASGERLLEGSEPERRLIEVGSWQLLDDDDLRVSICASRYPLDHGHLVDEAEALALDVAGRCIVEELAAGL